MRFRGSRRKIAPLCVSFGRIPVIMSGTLILTGGTGLIGRYLSRAWLRRGGRVHILTRTPEKYASGPRLRYFGWNPLKRQIDSRVFEGADALVHLAGANIGARRWTEAYKAEMTGSRILSLKFLRQRMEREGIRLGSFAGASAIGYYGCRTDKIPRTETDPPGDDFPARLAMAWEEESMRMRSVAERVSILRTGVVFAPEAGALPKMLRPLRWGLPVILGSGRQYVNWIAAEDMARMYVHALEEAWEGVYNAVAPRPVTYRELIRTAARLKGIPCCLPPVPAGLLKLFLGEMACIVTEGMPVSAEKAARKGFKWKFTEVEDYLRYIGWGGKAGSSAE